MSTIFSWYGLDVFEHKIGSHINMRGLFYINTYPASHTGSSIFSEDIIWKETNTTAAC